MSLWDWAAARAENAHDVHAVAQEIGARPEAEDPARIYYYFHSGADTDGYQQAQRSAQALTGALADHADGLEAATRALSAGWSGAAAQTALAALAPLRARLDGLSDRAHTAAQQVSAQLSTFNDTRHKVIPVPRQAPHAGGLAAGTTPAAMLSTSAHTVVRCYQANAQANQQAYSGYAAATGPQAAALGLPAGLAVPGPAPAGGRHRRKEQDEEQRTPPVLVQDEADIDPVVPPVIGE